MNLIKVNFEELYQRHLCRHSQFGINVLHLIAVAGIYFSLFEIALSSPGAEWFVSGVLSAYFVLLLASIPLRVWFVTLLAIGLLLATALALPRLSVWIYLVMILAWHRFQVWNHRVYDHSHPMEAFAQKYRKGLRLFVLLAVYELPILLNYLVFDRRNWEAYQLSGPVLSHDAGMSTSSND
jgi:hypothetical protein